mmetsp:Transcript_18310/g.41896  ORF Transcript_18310/g.41896 Transcript_18310/m.41896 type:complete len:91 (+) Transcript_18310:1214-1486(+)
MPGLEGGMSRLSGDTRGRSAIGTFYNMPKALAVSCSRFNSWSSSNMQEAARDLVSKEKGIGGLVGANTWRCVCTATENGDLPQKPLSGIL